MAARKRSTRKAKRTPKRAATANRRTPARRTVRAPPEVDVPANWSLTDGGKSMSVDVDTKDFLEAVALINDLAAVAEELEHHPDIHLTRWNRLRVTTWSHDVGKLTGRDERLAVRVNELLAKRRLL